MKITRRSALAIGASSVSSVMASLLSSGVARAEGGPPRSTAASVLFVSHGAPLFMPGNEARIAALRAWGERLRAPRGIVVMTPHFASRTPSLGASGPGFAMYNLPAGMKRMLPQDLEYATPESSQIAARVDSLLGGGLARPSRRGFDHSTWMPLKCLFPRADLPVVEIAYPYVTPAESFALGKRLAALRDEDIMFVASGGMTHNLAAGSQSLAGLAEFDGWVTNRLEKRAIDDLIDFRAQAPAVELAHPDDGAHYRVLLCALGIAEYAKATAGSVHFPVTGVDRCVELS